MYPQCFKPEQSPGPGDNYIPAVFQARTINRSPGGRTFNPPGSAYHQVALRMRAAFEAVRATKIRSHATGHARHYFADAGSYL